MYYLLAKITLCAAVQSALSMEAVSQSPGVTSSVGRMVQHQAPAQHRGLRQPRLHCVYIIYISI